MPRQIVILLSVITFLAMLAALGGCSDTEQPAAESTQDAASTGKEPAISADLNNSDFDLADTDTPGGRVYMQACASCHEAGLNRAPQRAMLSLMTPETIYRALTRGVMQAQAALLTDEDKVLVSEFLAKTSLNLDVATTEPVFCEGDAANFDYDEPPVFAGWGLDPASSHMIPTKTAGLDKSNIQSLKLKWAFAFPGANRTRSQPALAGGALYVGSHGGTVYAFDQESGCARWTFDASAEVRTGIIVSPWTRGDLSAKPMVFFADLIGNVYALDAITGEQQWRERPEEHANTTLTGTPTLYNSKLYVPVSSLEVVPAADPTYECCHFRGSVVAYEATTGKQLWKSFTIPTEPIPQGRNSIGTQNWGPSGAPVWNSPAIDAKRQQLIVGTGENYSSPASGESDALIAFDLESGDINWVFQATEGDAWNVACGEVTGPNCPEENGPDFDFGAGSIVATDTNGRDYILGGQKSGVVHAVSPDTGELIWQTKVGRGGVHAGVYFGMAVQGDRVFVPISDTPDGRDYDEPRQPGMNALNLKTGDFVWRVPAEDVCRDDQMFCQPGYAAAITVTEELVLAGSNDGHFRIYDTDTGDKLWDFDTAVEFPSVDGSIARGGGFGGGAAPLAYQGKLILNSGYGFALKMPGNALLVFEATSLKSK